MSERTAVTIVAFGDSITAAKEQADDAARWPTIVEATLRAENPDLAITVINAGVGGNTSREGLARIAADVLAHRPDYVTVEFGNDMTFVPERHVDLVEYRANIGSIMAQVAAIGGMTITMTFPPIIAEWHQHHAHPHYQPTGGIDRTQEQYREVIRDIAATTGCPLVELDLAYREHLEAHGPAAGLMPDGVHLTTQGNVWCAAIVATVLSPILAAHPRR